MCMKLDVFDCWQRAVVQDSVASRLTRLLAILRLALFVKFFEFVFWQKKEGCSHSSRKPPFCHSKQSSFKERHILSSPIHHQFSSKIIILNATGIVQNEGICMTFTCLSSFILHTSARQKCISHLLENLI